MAWLVQNLSSVKGLRRKAKLLSGVKQGTAMNATSFVLVTENGDGPELTHSVSVYFFHRGCSPDSDEYNRQDAYGLR